MLSLYQHTIGQDTSGGRSEQRLPHWGGSPGPAGVEEAESPPALSREQGAFRGGGTAGPGTMGPERALSLIGRRLWHPPMNSVCSGEGSGLEGHRGPRKQALSEWNHFLLDAAGWKNTLRSAEDKVIPKYGPTSVFKYAVYTCTCTG